MATKQEEIREGIHQKAVTDVIWMWLLRTLDAHSRGEKIGKWQLDELKQELAEKGVVIRVDRELPNKVPDLCVCNLVEDRGYPNCIAGYVAVEPLIKE